MAYVMNNIRFRSTSSKVIERFYNAKSFILNEMLDERKQFSPTARELLLLLFNSYSGWILQVESLMLNKTVITEDDLNTIYEGQAATMASNEEILNIHDTLFVPEFVSTWKGVHVHVTNNFIRRVGETVGLTNLEAFPLLVDALIGGLQTTLFELYELDCLLGSNLAREVVTTNGRHQEHMITYVDSETLNHASATGVFALAERLKYYDEHVFRQDCTIPLLVKNYTEESVALKNGTVVGEQPLARLLTELMTNPRIKIVEIIH